MQDHLDAWSRALPDALPVVVQGDLFIAYFAYVDLARVKAGQTVLITDASHCSGPSFVQLGKALGVNVIAATKNADERESLLKLALLIANTTGLYPGFAGKTNRQH